MNLNCNLTHHFKQDKQSVTHRHIFMSNEYLTRPISSTKISNDHKNFMIWCNWKLLDFTVHRKFINIYTSLRNTLHMVCWNNNSHAESKESGCPNQNQFPKLCGYNNFLKKPIINNKLLDYYIESVVRIIQMLGPIGRQWTFSMQEAWAFQSMLLKLIIKVFKPVILFIFCKKYQQN